MYGLSIYETLCPQPLVCPPFFSPGNLFINRFQLTKSEATSCKSTSCNSFRDILIGSFRCPNLQRALTQKMQRTITKKNFFFLISPGHLIITLYQLSKFEAPSCDDF